MGKKNISARVPDDLYAKLEEMSKQTGVNLTELINQAIASYLGESVETTGDRLSRLEQEVRELRGKLRILGSA